MSTERVVTDNGIIGEFMPKSGTFYLDPTNGVTLCELEHLEYHKRWDWLMPVVEKIERLDHSYDTRICYHADDGAYFCDIVDSEDYERACQVHHGSKIEAVYKAVVEFIKWYNSNGHTKENSPEDGVMKT